jgi:enoyl-CoA hydratase/carnithine racemase
MTESNTKTAAPVRVELDEGGVLRVTLDRPQVRNALDDATITALGEAFGERAHADDVRCVVLRGEGPSFCAGLDRGLLASLGGQDASPVREHGPMLQGVIDSIADCPRPTLAVVQGACVGGGVALLLACDLRIAASDSFFTMMEMRYAFVPDLGHVHRLQREVGMARAKEFLFFGERLEAATLGEWGVLNQVVPAPELDTAAERWTERMRDAAPLAVRTVKRILHAHPAGVDGAASQREALEANAGGLLGSDDFREGLTSALEGRKPRFQGR